MLLQLRDFIRRQRVVSTQQLVREFHMDEQALLPMLTIWLHRGVIRQCEEQVKPTACKSSCFRCDSKTPLYYQFVGS